MCIVRTAFLCYNSDNHYESGKIMSEDFLKNCTLCPRNCKKDRTVNEGFCGAQDKIKLARAGLHMWEEPCISGTNGSGTVFFSGCQLKCCFCQNYKISSQNYGKEISTERLSEIFLELQDKKAHNINLVSGTQFVPFIIKALDNIKGKLKIPVVYNCGGYEKIETLRMLEGYVDIYLPDLKYKSSDMAKKYSKAENYFETATTAIKEMFRQSGKIQLDENGIIKKGTIIRHLVLPNGRKDSIEIVNWIADNFNKDEIYLSLMSQYTPFYKSSEYPEINRRISTFEYNSVANEVIKRGLKGYMQEKSSAKEEYTPDFDLFGL